MTKVFVATSNKGKQAEITKYAAKYGEGIELQFPDSSNKIDVEESGTTFEENALLKAEAYRVKLGDASILFVGDDSGIKIPALGGEPGVFTRRWAGYEMRDDEILAYCMKKMEGLAGDQRKAEFQTVLATVRTGEAPRYFTGTMAGHILEDPVDTEPVEGFPFRSIFWVDEIDRPIYEIHSLAPEERGGFLTHREKAFRQLFQSLAAKS